MNYIHDDLNKKQRFRVINYRFYRNCGFANSISLYDY